MRKLILSLSVVLLGLTGFVSNSSAQWRSSQPGGQPVAEPARDNDNRYDARDRGPGREDDRFDRDRGLRSEVEQLNREVRQVREQIRSAGGGGRRVRADFHEVVVATDRLNAIQGRVRGWEVRRRIDEIRGQLERVRRQLKFRGETRNWR